MGLFVIATVFRANNSEPLTVSLGRTTSAEIRRTRLIVHNRFTREWVYTGTPLFPTEEEKV